MAKTALQGLPGWTSQHVTQLAKSWIDSAEQVVAVSATSGGLQSLAQQLHVTEEEARDLVEAARRALSPRSQAEMGQRFDADDRGLGVMRPRKEGDTD